MRRFNHGFTLVELLLAMAVLALLILFVTSLINSAATITTLDSKRMDADSQARQLLDRMAIDFTQMVKRSDVDYYLKSSANPQTAGNDQLAFYSTVAGYCPATSTSAQRSPISLVSYRINSQNKLERMGKGLVWNGSTTDTPMVFWATIAATWPTATTTASDPDYEEIGPQVFRFEYYYLLRNGTVSDTPWDTSAGHTSVTGMQDVAAIVADIAMIDPKSKVLLSDPQIATFTASSQANFLANYATGVAPGQLLAQWQNKLDGITSLPRPAVSGIRLYERYFYLSPPTL
jgi:type II secretion system protein J